jgi:hypothetical protein
MKSQITHHGFLAEKNQIARANKLFDFWNLRTLNVFNINKNIRLCWWIDRLGVPIATPFNRMLGLAFLSLPKASIFPRGFCAECNHASPRMPRVHMHLFFFYFFQFFAAPNASFSPRLPSKPNNVMSHMHLFTQNHS